VVAGCWRLFISLLGDVRFFLRAASGRRETPAAPTSIVHRSSPSTAEVPIAIQNLHVIYPDGGLARLKRLLPHGDIPVGHRPVAGFHALRGIELNIEHGVFGLLGPNGAGKTTLMRCIAGLLEPSRGTVRLYGVAQRDAGESLAPLIGYLPQTHGHYGWMTLRQYLDTFALLTARTQRLALAMPGQNPLLAERLAGLTALHDPRARATTIDRIAEQVHLHEFLDERIGTFSGGMRQRAGIARVLLQAPPNLIVDEPTAGLDPMERVSVRLLLAQIARERTVIFSTHIVEDLEGVCSAIGILDRGELRFSGSPEALRARWQGRVWEVPVGEEGDAPLRERLLGTDARLLYRSTLSGRAGWRCLASESPVPGAVPVAVSIEDAFLGLLSAGGTD
jgi:ABC-type multidrug transport system ATPase subunit